MDDTKTAVPNVDDLKTKLARFIDKAITTAESMLGHDPGGAQAAIEAARSAESLSHDLTQHNLGG